MSGRAATINVIPGDYALSVGRAEMACPPGWGWVSLTDVARLESGHTPSREHAEYWDGGVPWIGIRDARAHHGGTIVDTAQTVTQAGLDNSAARLLPRGTVCLSRTASVGYVVVMGRDMATSQDFVNWVCGPTVDPAFLQKLLIAENRSLFRFGKGSTHTTIYYPEVKAFHVCLPPLNEQRRIVAKLEALQARSRRAREALDAVPPLLEKLRQSILAAAFRGDLTKDWRAKNKDVEPASKLLERIRKERRAKWEEAELAKLKAKGKAPADDKWKAKYKEPAPVDTTGLPELPEGWCWASVGEVFEVCVGATPSRAEPSYWNGGIPWVSSGEVAFCRIRTTRESITDRGLAESSSKMHPPGTVLLGMIGEGKTRGQAAILDIDACTNQNAAAIRVAVTPIPPEYVYRFLEYEYERTRRVGSGNNQQALNKARVEAIFIAVAPLAEQGEIRSRLDELLGVADRLDAAHASVGASQNALERAVLAKAFRGELVPQDPNDESADAMLARVRAEREVVAAVDTVAKKVEAKSAKGTRRRA